MMRYQILKEELIFDDFFQIKKAKIRHETFDSGTLEVERLCLERGDSVGVLLFERDTDSFLFTNQFRYPAIKEGNGWIIELPAGSIDENEDPEKRVKKEVEEEIGYQINQVEFIYSFFVSPGGSSERIWLYFAEVDSTQKVKKGGGNINEYEDIQLLKVRSSEVKTLLLSNKIRDAKTIIGLQWFFGNQNEKASAFSL